MSEDLPQGWVESLIGDIAKVVGGGTPKTKDESNFVDKDGIPWITPADLSGYKKIHISHGKRFLSQKGLDTSSATLMPEGTVLFSSRAPVGYVAIASNPVATNQGFKSFVLKEGVNSKYVYYYLRNSKSIAEKLSSGTTFLELSGKNAAKIPIKIPPFLEQKRIADKLDCLLAKVDTCKARLDKVPEIIKRFRQSVLADATSGRLTEDWRNHKNIEYNWKRNTIENLIEGIRYGTSKKCSYDDSLTPVLRIPNISDHGIDKTDMKYADFNERELESLSLKKGDLLLIRSNGSASLIGKVNIISKDEEGFLYAGYLIRLRLKKEEILPEYLKIHMSSPKIRKQIEVGARSTSGVHNINSKEVCSIKVNLPEMDEQKEIVKRVESLFSVASQMEEKLKRAQNGVDKLTASILVKAFRGELVPQDINEEPADKMLEHI
ncbi:restriction endonuclease subunit S [bacterium]|nr:restriction endonuclease subunit S [bacterium]